MDATGQLMDLQRKLDVQSSGTIPEKTVPEVATILSRGGIRGSALVSSTEELIRAAPGAGIDVNTLARFEADLVAKFGLTADTARLQIAGVINDAQQLRIPFDDMSKWLISVQERLRLFGYDVDDSRRIVRAFGEDIHKGNISLGELIATLESTAKLNTGQGVVIASFAKQLSDAISPEFVKDMQSLGSSLEQGLFINAIFEGRVTDKALDLAEPAEKATLEKYFTGKGDLLDESLKLKLRGAMTDIAMSMMGDIKGALTQEEMLKEFLKMLGIPVSDVAVTRDVQDRLAKLGAGQGDGVKLQDVMTKLVKNGDAIIDERAKMSDHVYTGLKLFWRDTASDIALTFSRLFGNDADDVKAQMRTSGGRQAIQNVAGLSGVSNIYGEGAVSATSLETAIKLVMESSLDSGQWGRRAKTSSSAIADLLDFFRDKGQISDDDEKRLSAMLSPSALGFHSFEGSWTRAPGTSTSFRDVNSALPGTQISLGGVVVTINAVDGKITEDTVRDAVNQVYQKTSAELRKNGLMH
jgi:hypothetical protein